MSDGEATGSKVPLEVDEDKLEAWREVKPDYEVNPDGEPVPNSMDTVDTVDTADNADNADSADSAGSSDDEGR